MFPCKLTLPSLIWPRIILKLWIKFKNSHPQDGIAKTLSSCTQGARKDIDVFENLSSFQFRRIFFHGFNQFFEFFELLTINKYTV